MALVVSGKASKTCMIASFTLQDYGSVYLVHAKRPYGRTARMRDDGTFSLLYRLSGHSRHRKNGQMWYRFRGCVEDFDHVLAWLERDPATFPSRRKTRSTA